MGGAGQGGLVQALGGAGRGEKALGKKALGEKALGEKALGEKGGALGSQVLEARHGASHWLVLLGGQRLAVPSKLLELQPSGDPGVSILESIHID
eukprot:COSAG01_NODE_1191_length_11314_cov_59.567722_4_plen_95_part_00